MNRNEFVQFMDSQLKLIRTEYGLNQEDMANFLGLSKKSVVEIEKGRNSLGWKGAVVCASVFSNSNILIHSIGGDITDFIIAIAFNNKETHYPKTLGGKIWWKEIESANGYVIQQNMISHHYRLLDPQKGRRFASFNLILCQEMLLSYQAN